MIAKSDNHGMTIEFEGSRETIIMDVGTGEVRFFLADEHGEVGDNPPFAQLALKCEKPE
jgi:hypothetical protein